MPPFSDEDVPAGRLNVVDGAAVDAAHLNLLFFELRVRRRDILSPDDDKRRDGDGHHRAPTGDVPPDGAVPFPLLHHPAADGGVARDVKSVQHGAVAPLRLQKLESKVRIIQSRDAEVAELVHDRLAVTARLPPSR